MDLTTDADDEVLCLAISRRDSAIDARETGHDHRRARTPAVAPQGIEQHPSVVSAKCIRRHADGPDKTTAQVHILGAADQ